MARNVCLVCFISTVNGCKNICSTDRRGTYRKKLQNSTTLLIARHCAIKRLK